MPSSKQNAHGIPNFYDCGPFALAFATALVNGEDPSKIEFVRALVRQHVQDSLQKKRGPAVSFLYSETEIYENHEIRFESALSLPFTI